MILLVYFEIFLLHQVSTLGTLQLDLFQSEILLQWTVVGGEIFHNLSTQMTFVNVHEVVIFLFMSLEIYKPHTTDVAFLFRPQAKVNFLHVELTEGFLAVRSVAFWA